VELYLHSPFVFVALCLIKHRVNFTRVLFSKYFGNHTSVPISNILTKDITYTPEKEIPLLSHKLFPLSNRVLLICSTKK
jgi:hypothetical protein